MAGTILENLSGRKLAVLVACIFVAQVVCYLVGGFIAPAPSNVENILATICVTNKQKFDDEWHIPRGKNSQHVNCIAVENFKDPLIAKQSVTANQIVFAWQIPLPKERMELDYSRWMQNLIGILQLDIAYDKERPVAKKPVLTLDARLGYRNKWDPPEKWTEYAHSMTERTLECKINETRKLPGYLYDCNVLPFFELGSLHHDFYLINLRLPVAMSTLDKPLNEGIGNLDNIWLVAINQNGGFTKVWVSIKTVFMPIIIATMIWYWRRITLLARPPVLIEKMILGLGCAMTILNLPLEYLTLFLDMPFMLLLSDIRQGVFYAALLSFWLIFCGEHLMDGRKDGMDRNRIGVYWKHLSAVIFGCICLFVFDMCERGVQLKNPFYSIWSTELGTNLALAFIILAGISASLYFLFLCYMVYRVFCNISMKRSALPAMSSARRMYYEGIIYRFKFLMIVTLFCAALTVISYIIGQVSEGRWKWDENIELQYTSAFFTGVYGMWNLYVFALLVLYAPSHKFYSQPADVHSSSAEEIECSRLTASEVSPGEPTEASSLTEFARKAAMD